MGYQLGTVQSVTERAPESITKMNEEIGDVIAKPVYRIDALELLLEAHREQ